MEEDLNLLTKKKLIELAKHLGVSTSGTKSDIIDRLERQRNKSVKKKPKKLTDEEYFRQKEILEQELEIERLNQIKRDHERKLKFLKLESLRHGDDIEKSDESLEESRRMRMKTQQRELLPRNHRERRVNNRWTKMRAF